MPDAKIRALTALRRLRKVETDQARRELGEFLAAAAALAARIAAIHAEIDAARRMTGEFDRESFSAWLGRVHTDRLRLAQESRDAEAHSAASRVALAHRRVAEAAAEEALAREMTARASELARRDQVMLEDVARVLRQAENER